MAAGRNSHQERILAAVADVANLGHRQIKELDRFDFHGMFTSFKIQLANIAWISYIESVRLQCPIPPRSSALWETNVSNVDINR